MGKRDQRVDAGIERLPVFARHRCAVLVALTCAVASHVALAQGRYHVIVGSTNGVAGTLVEFQPCVTAEGSDCGGRIEQRIIFGRSRDFPRAPDVIASLPLWDEKDTLRIDRDGLVMRHHGIETRLDDRRGAITAIALADSPPYAFAVIDGRRITPNYVVMIDTATQDIIASCAVPTLVQGVKLVPMR